LLYRAARRERGREARERFLTAPFARTQSESRGRLVLANGFSAITIPVHIASLSSKLSTTKRLIARLNALGFEPNVSMARKGGLSVTAGGTTELQCVGCIARNV
jgi:hypothetical protein